MTSEKKCACDQQVLRYDEPYIEAYGTDGRAVTVHTADRCDIMPCHPNEAGQALSSENERLRAEVKDLTSKLERVQSWAANCRTAIHESTRRAAANVQRVLADVGWTPDYMERALAAEEKVRNVYVEARVLLSRDRLSTDREDYAEILRRVGNKMLVAIGREDEVVRDEQGA